MVSPSGFEFMVMQQKNSERIFEIRVKIGSDITGGFILLGKGYGKQHCEEDS